MSQRQRGQEVEILFTVEGQEQKGSWLKITDWSLKPRTDIVEDEFLGESETDLDIQHHGYDYSFSIQNQDSAALEYMALIVDRELKRLRHPVVTMTVLHLYREVGAKDRIQVFQTNVMKVDEIAVGGRKERTKAVFSGKCKTSDLNTVS
jgi:hypothetical protein